MIIRNDLLFQDVTCNISSLVLPLILKKKAIPLQAWTGPEGSRRFRLHDFKTIGT